MRAAVLGLVLLGSALVLPRVLVAEELDGPTRSKIEHAFMAGRLDDVRALLVDADDPLDKQVLTLLDTWWRGPLAEGASSLEPPPWVATGGGADPYPLISEIVQDRIERETQGVGGRPEAGPLEDYWNTHKKAMGTKQHVVFENVYRMMLRSYKGDDDPHEQAMLDRKAREGMLTAKLAWLCSLGAFLVLSFFGALVVARRVRALPTEAPSSEAAS